MDTRDEPTRVPGDSGEAMGASPDDLEQVRKLLFGSHARTQDRRIERLEERVARDAAALRADVTLRIDTLRDEIRDELRELGKAVGEIAEEGKQLAQLVRERLDGAGDALERRLEELRAEAVAAHEELERRAASETQGVREGVENARARDRQELARLFAAVAKNLASSEGREKA